MTTTINIFKKINTLRKQVFSAVRAFQNNLNAIVYSTTKEVMNPFFCIHCSRTSFFDERFQCIHCGNRAYLAAVKEVLNLPIPETESLIPENHARTSDSGNEKNEEYCFQLVQQSREASIQMFEEGSNLPLKIIGSDGYENCSKSVCDSPRVNETAQDFEHYPNVNQNCFPSNSNTKEGQFHIPSYDIGNDAASLGVIGDTASASQETYLFEQTSVREGENKNNSDELLGCQGIKETTEHTKNADKIVWTDPNTFETEYPAVNIFSDSSDNAEDRQDKNNTTPSCSSFPRGNSSVNKCFQHLQRHVKTHTNLSPSFSSSSSLNSSVSRSFHENLATANIKAQQKSQPSSKLWRRNCPKCGSYFLKEATYIVHIRSNCNPNPYKCKECDARFPHEYSLVNHGRVHTQEKPFKCTQCDYASKWPQNLKRHLETHH